MLKLVFMRTVVLPESLRLTVLVGCQAVVSAVFVSRDDKLCKARCLLSKHHDTKLRNIRALLLASQPLFTKVLTPLGRVTGKTRVC